MLTSEQVLDAYFLENRCMLLEFAAMLDRYDRAGESTPTAAGRSPGDPRLDMIYRALSILVDRDTPPDRTERLQILFSDPVD